MELYHSLTAPIMYLVQEVPTQACRSLQGAPGTLLSFSSVARDEGYSTVLVKAALGQSNEEKAAPLRSHMESRGSRCKFTVRSHSVMQSTRKARKVKIKEAI